MWPNYCNEFIVGVRGSMIWVAGKDSSAKGARIKAPQAPRVGICGSWGGGVPLLRGVPLLSGGGIRGGGRPVPVNVFIFGSRNACFGAFSGPFE